MTSSPLAEASPSPSPIIPAAVQANAVAQDQSKKSTDDGLSFSDLLGVINPLQHIPIISTVYRELTGDKISPAAQIAGDGLYGGIFGLASSIVNEVVQATTGNDIGGHIWATVFGDDDDAPAGQVQTADVGTTASAASSPPSTPTPVQAAATASPDATNGGVAAEVPVTPLNGPTSFFQTMQAGAHHPKAVPLSTSVPVADPRRNPNNPDMPPGALAPAQPSAQPQSGAEALLQAQQPTGALGAQAAQAAALGTSGLSASTSTPPPAIAAAPPPPNTLAAPAVQGNIADKMMQGLDAYKALALKQDAQDAASQLPASTPSDTSVSSTALIN